MREFSGLTRAQIEEQFPGFLEDGRRPPGWEDDDALLARILEGLNRLADIVGDRTALVVTHGGVIYTLEDHLGCPPVPGHQHERPVGDDLQRPDSSR